MGGVEPVAPHAWAGVLSATTIFAGTGKLPGMLPVHLHYFDDGGDRDLPGYTFDDHAERPTSARTTGGQMPRFWHQTVDGATHFLEENALADHSRIVGIATENLNCKCLNSSHVDPSTNRWMKISATGKNKDKQRRARRA